MAKQGNTISEDPMEQVSYYQKNAKFAYNPVKYSDFKSGFKFVDLLTTPVFLYTIIKAVYHVGVAVLIGIPMASGDQARSLKRHVFSSIRSLQEGAGFIIRPFHHKLGLFWIEESRYHQQAYRFFTANINDIILQYIKNKELDRALEKYQTSVKSAISRKTLVQLNKLSAEMFSKLLKNNVTTALAYIKEHGMNHTPEQTGIFYALLTSHYIELNQAGEALKMVTRYYSCSDAISRNRKVEKIVLESMIDLYLTNKNICDFLDFIKKFNCILDSKIDNKKNPSFDSSFTKKMSKKIISATELDDRHVVLEKLYNPHNTISNTKGYINQKDYLRDLMQLALYYWYIQDDKQLASLIGSKIVHCLVEKNVKLSDDIFTYFRSQKKIPIRCTNIANEFLRALRPCSIEDLLWQLEFVTKDISAYIGVEIRLEYHASRPRHDSRTGEDISSVYRNAYLTLRLNGSGRPTNEEIIQAWKELCRQWHPDKNLGNEEAAAEKMKEINAAKELLMPKIKSTHET
jgi:hypothetical protein